MNSPSEALLELLSALEICHGPSPSGDVKKLAVVWHHVCGRFTPDQINAAVIPMLGKKTYGWPKPSDLIEVIEGKVISVPEYATDLGGARFSKFIGGPLVVKTKHDVRVPFDWVGCPDELDWWKLTPEIKAFHAELEAAKALTLGMGDPQ